jgi:hypothetical protein
MKKLTYLILLFSGIFFSQKKEIINDSNISGMKDHIITKNLDTISENIEIKDGFNKFKIKHQNKKIKIKNIISFKHYGIEYHYKKKRKISLGDKRYAFLKLIEKGEVNLFEYKIEGSFMDGMKQDDAIYYYIERNNKMNLIIPTRFYKMIKRILPENEKLHKMIREKEFTYYDISLVIKYFNEHQKI